MFNNQPGSGQTQAQIDLSKIASLKLPLATWNIILAGLWELPAKVALPAIREVEQQLRPHMPQQAPIGGQQNSLHSEALADE